MTFPAHQGLILPLARKRPAAFDALALSVGAAMPDITDSVLGFLLNGYFKQWYGHALVGIFTLDLVGGLIITWLIAVIGTALLYGRHLPQRLQTVLAKAQPNREPAAGRISMVPRRTRLGLWSFSVLMGIVSHVGFDLISHDTNLLLYPWQENVRWFPEWWYRTWFEIQPVPMFGESYAVGLFTVVWIVLSLIGVFLFVRFLGSSHKSRV